MHRNVASTLVARRYWEIAAKDGTPLTPLKFQKLVFLAHGWSFPFLSRPLISESVEAWPLGPVFPELYIALKQYGAGGVKEVPESTREWLEKNKNNISLEDDEKKLIDDVFYAYGHLSGSNLVTLTHKDGSPWDIAVKLNGGTANGQVISQETIRDFYIDEYQKLPEN